MANLITAAVSIEGTRPLLQHHFTPEALPLEKKEREGVPGNNPNEWYQSALVNEQGQLYLPSTYVFSCLRQAAVFTTRKRRTQQEVEATLQVMEPVILIEDRFLPKELEQINQLSPVDRPEVYIDVSIVRNPGSGGRNVRYRLATRSGWRCQFQLQWDKTVVSRELMEAICLDAGQLVGIADGRRIGFGRFTVRQFEIVEAA